MGSSARHGGRGTRGRRGWRGRALVEEGGGMSGGGGGGEGEWAGKAGAGAREEEKGAMREERVFAGRSEGCCKARQHYTNSWEEEESEWIGCMF